MRGGGAFNLNSETGFNLPAGINVDISLRDGSYKSADGRFALDVAAGSKLQLRNAELDLNNKGKPVKMALAPGSAFHGALDGAKIPIPGMKEPLTLGAGTRFDFEVQDAVADAGGVKRVAGKMSMEATVEASKLNMAQLKAAGVQVEMVDGLRARLRVDIERVRLGDDGRFDLDGASVGLTASAGTVSGTYKPN